MHRVNFGPMVIAGLEFSPPAEATPFEHIEFLSLRMTMRGIAAAWSHAKKRGGTTGDWIEKKHFG